MRIGFSEQFNTEDGSGKHKFIFRLAKELMSRGVEVSTKQPDVYLYLPGSSPSESARCNILRLDGLIINNKEDYIAKNNKIVHNINKSDAVVYQNNFCRLAYERFLNVHPLRFACIPNGADPTAFLPRRKLNVFLANCRWRPHKRLKTIIDSFIVAAEQGINADLIVTGEPDYTPQHENIKYVGWQNPEQISSWLSTSIASLHLSWIDWCPNAMVEAIVAGCPVIYSNSGGHSCIAKGYGIEIDDIQWNYTPCDYYDPPPLSIKQITSAMFKLKNDNLTITNKDIHIDAVANRYLKFFEFVLKSKK